MATAATPRLSEKQMQILMELPAPDGTNRRQFDRLAELGLVFRNGDVFERKTAGDELLDYLKSEGFTNGDPAPAAKPAPAKKATQTKATPKATAAKPKAAPKERTSKHVVRESVTPQIRGMRKHLKWSSEEWKAFTVADFQARMKRLVTEAQEVLAQIKQ